VRALLGACLADSSPRVRLAALRASGALLAALSKPKDHRAMRDLLPSLLAATEDALGLRAGGPLAVGGGGGGASGGGATDEDAACVVFETLGELLECGSPLLEGDDVREGVARAMLAALRAERLEPMTRAAASEVLGSLANARAKWLASRAPLLAAILEGALACIEGGDPEARAEALAAAAESGVDAEEAEGADDGEGDVGAIGGRLLDTLANALPEKALYPILMARVVPALRGDAGVPPLTAASAAEPWRIRYAAAMALGTAAEGCSTAMARDLAAILDTLLPTVTDGAPAVRAACCYALSLLSDHCQPRSLRAHARILPAALTLLGDGDPSVVLRATWVLESFAEALDLHVVRIYLPGLMDALGGLLARPALHPGVAEGALAAVAALAAASKADFAPYVPGVAGSLLAILSAPPPPAPGAPLPRIRAKAAATMGQLAFAIGPAWLP
jgi:hypothetical protein